MFNVGVAFFLRASVHILQGNFLSDISTPGVAEQEPPGQCGCDVGLTGAWWQRLADEHPQRVQDSPADASTTASSETLHKF